MRDIPSRFADALSEVYATARESGLSLDGQNVFIYRNCTDGETDVDFGVGVDAPFAPIGNIICTATPAGAVATITHWGEYGALRGAHAAIIEWCRMCGRTLEGTRWEVYGHWNANPAQCRTDIFYLLAAT